MCNMAVFLHTSRYFLHEDLDESVLTDRAQVLHNVPVFQPLMQSYFLMKGLRVPGTNRTEYMEYHRREPSPMLPYQV